MIMATRKPSFKQEQVTSGYITFSRPTSKVLSHHHHASLPRQAFQAAARLGLTLDQSSKQSHIVKAFLQFLKGNVYDQ